MSNARHGRFVNGVKHDPINGYVEIDPSGRYGRFKEVLGKGAMKVVYRGFDEVLGMEVAWNQIKIHDACRSPDELQRLYSEVHLLKNLHHDSIIQFHTSWIDSNRRNFNFITEMFTSGTLREYRQKYKRVDTRAIKNWARQILRGLTYLHGLSPPVIHRDLKCDNIFMNGHLGLVKIGDLGLAAILRGSDQHAHSVIGTPEFMAPELYEEDYDELVDIYSFGMCVLEMLTSEYPYSECSNPAQIYKKVTSGRLPEAFHKIQDPEAKRFVGKCLENVSKRLPARELLRDPFLACGDERESLRINRAQMQRSTSGLIADVGVQSALPVPKRTTNMSITGTLKPEDDTIFLKVQISDLDGSNARNIYFPFDIVNDTANEVAAEMVRELEISDWEAGEIAEMIEEQISSLVPNWKSSDSPRLVVDNIGYEEEEDEEEEEIDDDNIIDNQQPFYNYSSSSSQNSLLTSKNLPHGNNMNSIDRNWIQDNQVISDDTSSVSSFNSINYSNINYYSAIEDTDNDGSYNSALKSSRFRPPVSQRVSPWGTPASPRLSRIKSLVDVRSQLLHRSLVEEINKRRMFKTVGSIENIGFQELDHDGTTSMYI